MHLTLLENYEASVLLCWQQSMERRVMFGAWNKSNLHLPLSQGLAAWYLMHMHHGLILGKASSQKCSYVDG